MTSDEHDDVFEPWDLLRVEVEFQNQPARVSEPNDAIRHGTARLVRYSVEGERGAVVAELQWMQVEYGYGASHGVDAFEIADAESQDLHDIHCLLFDDDDELRTRFEHLEQIGSDLIVIERVLVHEKDRAQLFAEELVEHLLRRWAHDCFAAVYAEDVEMDPALRDALIARGFEWQSTKPFCIFRADLNARRPELSGEAALPGAPKRSQTTGH